MSYGSQTKSIVEPGYQFDGAVSYGSWISLLPNNNVVIRHGVNKKYSTNPNQMKKRRSKS